MATAFGLPDETPAFGYMKMAAFFAVIAGIVAWIAEADPAITGTLFWGGLFVGAVGLGLGWQQSRRQEFNRQLDDYEAGRRDDLPQ